jgi:hypothetical protein
LGASEKDADSCIGNERLRSVNGEPRLRSAGYRIGPPTAARVYQEEFVKSSLQIKKISVRRTGDIRLTSAACACPYHITAV